MTHAAARSLLALALGLGASPAGVACNLATPAKGWLVHKNLAYGPDALQQLDLYLPTAVKNPPLILDIHGGGFINGDKADRVNYAIQEAQNGLAVAELDFRLSSWSGTTAVNPFPSPNEDGRCAVAWLRQNQATYGYNATKIGAVGYSSGAVLAAFLGVNGPYNDPACAAINAGFSPDIQAVVAYYGVFDYLTPSGFEEQVGAAPGTSTPYLSPSTTATGQAASPVSYASATSAAFRFVLGTKDTVAPLSQDDEMVAALAKFGIHVEISQQSGMTHGFNPWNPALYPQDPLLGSSTCRTVAFLQQYLQ